MKPITVTRPLSVHPEYGERSLIVQALPDADPNGKQRIEINVDGPLAGLFSIITPLYADDLPSVVILAHRAEEFANNVTIEELGSAEDNKIVFRDLRILRTLDHLYPWALEMAMRVSGGPIQSQTITGLSTSDLKLIRNTLSIVVSEINA